MSETTPVPEPQAGGSYTRDPVTNELSRNDAQSTAIDTDQAEQEPTTTTNASIVGQDQE